MTEKIILDTGPLVAFLNKNDDYHDWAALQLNLMEPPLFTCESVISEACYLLNQYHNGPAKVLELISRDLIEIKFDLTNEYQSIKKMIDKYNNVPMSFADSCLVRMAEIIEDSKVFTLDTDFRIYRKNKNEVIPTIMPEK